MKGEDARQPGPLAACEHLSLRPAGADERIELAPAPGTKEIGDGRPRQVLLAVSQGGVAVHHLEHPHARTLRTRLLDEIQESPEHDGQV